MPDPADILTIDCADRICFPRQGTNDDDDF